MLDTHNYAKVNTEGIEFTDFDFSESSGKSENGKRYNVVKRNDKRDDSRRLAVRKNIARGDTLNKLNERE